MKAKLIQCNGKEKFVTINSFDDARKVVCEYGYDSPLEIITMPNGNLLLLDEEGKLKNLPFNELATEMAHEQEVIYPSDVIVGDVILIEDANEFDDLPYE